MITDHDWNIISNKAFPKTSAKASPFLWTRILAGIKAEETRRASSWWMQWRWMLRLTFAVAFLTIGGSYYLINSSTLPLDSALEGISSQHQAILMAHNPDMTPDDVRGARCRDKFMSGKLKAILLMAVMFRPDWEWSPESPGKPSSTGSPGSTRTRYLPNADIKKLEALGVEFIAGTKNKPCVTSSKKAHDRATEINEEVSWDLADIHRDSVQAIRQVLTPDQMKQFEKLHKKAHDKNKHLPEDDRRSR